MEANQGTAEVKEANQGNVEVAPQVEAANPGENPVTEAAKEAARKFRVKVMGEELEVDEDELKRGYSHQRAANKAMQEGLKKQRQAEEFINMLRDEGKLFDVLQQLGHDPRKLSEKYLGSMLEEEMMDPKDRKLKEYERMVQEREMKLKQIEEEKRNAQITELKKKYAEEYHKSFIEAIEGEKLPAAKDTIQEMARYIQRASKLGYKMEAKEAAKLVKEDMTRRLKSVIPEADGERLVNMLGPEVVEKIRKWDLARVKNPNQNLITPENQEPKEPRNREKKPMSHAEWRAFNRAKR
jgi:hypothetical protein